MEKIEPFPSFCDFQKIADILTIIQNKITPQTDVVWAGFNNPQEFLREITDDIDKIRSGDFDALAKINVEFAATCIYQELAMSNGWSKEYLELAEQFDAIYERILKNRNHPSSRPKRSFFNWRNIFGSN